MSVRLLARDLYRLQQEVDKLEKQLADAPFDQQESILARLRAARAERDRLRRVLDGQKDSPQKPRV
jgi:CHASE3 domain sensor protein